MTATVPGICRFKLKRQPNLRGIVATRRKNITGRHYSDNGSWLRVDLNLSADYVIGLPKSAPPQAVRDQYGERSAVAVFLCGEIPPASGLHAKRFNQSACHKRCRDSQRFFISSYVSSGYRPRTD